MDPLQKRRLNGLLLGSSCLVASAFVGLAPALAGTIAGGTLPTGGQFKGNGQGTITSSNGTVTVDQTSEKAFIDWKSFSIGANGTVVIDGPNKNAVTVNRVTGVNATEIDGALRANDNVWLLNGNGILFGKGSIINVGSLIATTSDLSDDDFKKGKYSFKSGRNPNASVINQGTIITRTGGSVVLSAAHVENEGVIQANMGSVVLGGADAFSVDFKGDNLIRYQITSEVKTAPTDSKGDVDKALVSNSGRIIANGGSVLMTSRAASNVQDNVINNSGMIEATSVSSHDGEVDLDAGSDGTVEDSGTINVSGERQGQSGGNVTITGQTINVADGAQIDAEGRRGGGTVLIGGNFHGQGTLQQATNVTIGKATINVSATRKGDGGKVAIWSKGNTVVDGTILARGGRLGGNGGFVETSGHDLSMSDTALVATGAAKGDGGTWLLDPTDIDIFNCGGGCGGSNVSSVAIANSLDGGTNVTVEASGNINVEANITGTSDPSGFYNGTGTLSLLAEGSIDITANIENQGNGAINLVAGWDGTTGITGSETNGESGGSVDIAAITGDKNAYGNNGGSVYLGQAFTSNNVAVGSEGGVVTVAADDLDIGPAPHGCFSANFQLGYLGSGGGDIDVFLSGDLNIQSEHGGTSRVGNGGSSDYTGAVTGNITIDAAEITMNQGQAYSFGVAAIGNYGGGAVGGNINITTSGDVLMGSASSNDTRVSIGNASAGTNNTTGNVSLNVGGNLSMYANDHGGTYIGSQSSTSNINVTVAQNITMTVGSSNSENSYVQIGNYGSSAANSVAGGNITVTSTRGNIVMTNNGDGFTQIGNGPANTVTGNIVVTAKKGDIELLNNYGGTVQIGNGPAGSSPGQQVSGNITVKATQGNITLDAEGKYSTVEIGNGSAVQTSGDIAVTAGGSISLTAGEKYTTARIGNDGSAGATSGNITVIAGGAITLYSGVNTQSQSNYHYGNSAVAQIGNGGGGMQGNASGNIVVSGGSLLIGSNYASAYSVIGNGDPFHGDIRNAGTGGAYGNISVKVAGATTLYNYGGLTAWIGNLADGGATEVGSVSIVTNSLAVIENTTADDLSLGDMVASDLTGSFTTGTANQGGTGGGNVTIAITGTGTTDWGDYFGEGLQVPNGNTLALITTGAMKVTTSIDNTEGGNIDLIAGWDGTTGLTASGINVSRVLSQHAYGASGGDIVIGGSGDVSVGTDFGNTTIAGANVSVSSYGGDFAMIGFTGSSSGNITVDATANITVSTPNGGFSQIGNGGENFTGDGGGNITVNAGGEVVLAALNGNVQIGNGGANSNGNFSGNIDVTADGAIVLEGDTQGGSGYAQIGNGGAGSNDGSDNGSNSGNITVEGSSITLDAGFGNDSYAQIGHGGTASNQSSDSSNTGNITVTATDGDIQLTGGSSGTQNAEQNDYAQIGMGGPFSGSDATNKDTGNITVNASGNIDVTGSTDTDEQNGFAIIGDTGTAKKTGNITVSAGGNIVVEGGNSTGNPNFDGTANSFAQIGDTNSGAITGNISVTAGGSLTIRGGDGNAGDTAWVGDTSSDSAVIGNVSITVDGTTIIDSYQSADQAGFGDTAGGGFTATGTTLLNTDDLALGSDSYGDFGKSLGSSLANGNVTVEIEDEDSENVIAGAVDYDSANTLKILDRGSLHIQSSIQNSGSGSIYVVGGWDGTTLNAADFTNAGVYGNHGGSITVGDVLGNVSVGSQGGSTVFAADDITLDAVDGVAQIGWNGEGGGNISVVASGNVTVETSNNSECDDCIAQIGNGGENVTGAITGNISVTTSGGFVLVESEGGTVSGDAHQAIAEIGNIGGTDSSEKGNISVDTNGGAVTLESDGGYSYAQIGDWSTVQGNNGTISGNITIDAGAVSLDASGTDASAQIGNGNFLSATSVGAISGNITINANDVSVTEESGTNDFEEARIGNLGGGVVTGTLSVDASGNVTINAQGEGAASISNFSNDFSCSGDTCSDSQGHASGIVNVEAGGNISVSSSGLYAFASIELGGATSGDIDVTAKNNITLSASGGAHAFIGASEADNGRANVVVTSKTGNIDIVSDGSDTFSVNGNQTTVYSNAQIGNAEDEDADTGGNIGGNVAISAASGNIAISTEAGATAQIGNLNTSDTVAGDLTIVAGKAFDIDSPNVAIGNTGPGETGNVSITATTLVGDITPYIKDDLPGGNFSVVLTGDGALTLSSDVDVDTSHNLTLSDGGDIDFAGSVLNSGSGNITVSSAGTVTIGSAGATGAVAVGSAAGTTTVNADNLVISADNGDSQLGYDAAGGGNIIVDAAGNVSLVGSNGNFAQIGDGSSFLSNAAGGNVTLAANSVSASGKADIAGATADIAMGTGNFGSAANSVELVVGALAIDSSGGNAFVTSPNGLSIGVGSDGIDLHGGGLVLTANGAVTQTQAIDASSIDIDGTTVTLTNTGNAFGDANLTSAGSVALFDTSSLTIDGADVGGKLTLTSDGNIGQSGTIDAGSLIVTANSIALENTANDFGNVTVTSSSDASFYDSADLVVASADVGGKLTLSSAANISQSGAIDAGSIDAIANSGSITLANTANDFGQVTVASSGDTSLFDGVALDVASASVGGKFTLSSSGNISQSGAIDAGSLDAIANNGSITLANTANDFGQVTVTSSGDTSLFDSGDLDVADADVGGKLTLSSSGNISQSGAIDAGSLAVTANVIALNNTANDFGHLTVTSSGDASFYDSADLAVAGADVGGNLTLASGGNISQLGAIDAGNLDVIANNGSITLTDTDNAVGGITLSAEGGASFYDTINLTVNGATIGGNLTLLTKGDLTFVKSVQLSNGDILAVAGWDGTTTGTSALESTAGAYGNNKASITIGGSSASGAVSVGSKTGTTTVLTGNLLVEAQNAGAQLGYAGAGSGNIVVEALDTVGVGSDQSNTVAQIGNGGTFFNGNAGGNITINATALTLVATDGGAAQIGNGGTDASGTASGDITVDLSGKFQEGVPGSGSQVQLGNGGFGYNGDASGDISVTAASALIEDTGDNSYVMLGNGGDRSKGDDSGAVSLTTTGNITATVTAGTAAIQIGNGGFESNGKDSGNVTLKAGGNISLGTTLAGTTSYIQVGDGGSKAQGSANGTVNVSGANISIATDNAGYVQIGNGGSEYDGNAAGNVTVSASNDILGDVDVDASYIQIGNGGFESTGNDSGNIALTAGNDLTLETTDSAGGTATSGSYLQIGNGGDSSNEDSAKGFSETGNITVSAKTIELSAGDAISGVHIGNGGTCAGAAGASNTECAGLADTTTNGSIAFGGNITVTATTSLSLTASGTDTLVQIGNGGNNAGLGANATGSITDTGNIAINGGNITLVGNDTNTFAIIGNFGPSETGNVTIDAVSLTGDLGASMGNDLTGGDFTVALTGNQTLTIATDVDYTSNHTLSLTNGGDIVFDASVQNAGSGAIDVTGADILIGGNGASGNVAVGSSGGTTTLTADNVTLDAVNGYAQLGYHGASGGDVSVDANGAVTLTGGNNSSHTAQIGNGSSFDSGSAGGAVNVTAASLGASGNADIAGQSADIIISGSGGVGSATNPLAFAVSDLAIETQGGDVFATASKGISIGVGANGIDLNGGDLSLTANGAVTQTQAITAGSIDITGSTITLTNSGNSFADATLTASGNASLDDNTNLTIDATDIGGTLTLAANGNIGQSGAITAQTLNATANGSIALTNSGNSFADASLTASGNASLADNTNLTIDGADIGGTLTLVDNGSIGQSGAITAKAVNATANGSIALTNSGNSFADVTLTASGNASLDDQTNLTIDSANVGGTLTLATKGNIGQSGAIDAKALNATTSGSIALTNAKNAIATATLSAGGDAALYDASSLTIDGASAGGNLTLLTEGNLTFVQSVQLKNGDLVAVAGWDGTTTNPSDLAQKGAYGNNGGSIIVGGSGANGDVAVGSQNGNTTLAGANVSLEADNGYAQVGYNGAGTGNIDVVATGNVTLGAGSATGDFAQIGNGGLGVSGNESGNITVDAGGVVALNGGGAKDAYAQIGHGGAEGDKDSKGYTNSGNITVEGKSVDLVAGSGDAGYAQIGNGGFDLGDGLTGKGVNEGAITVSATDGVSLKGGNGSDTYSQIGNGGDQTNKNASASASGSDSGDITVDAGSGSVTTTAGAGPNAYTQIGNGGFDANNGADAEAASFTMSGNITVSDLTLTASDGTDGYSQVGNGDASENSVGDASGNITIDAGTITLTSGTGTGDVALIGNATGDGTVSGTISGYTPPNDNGGGSTNAGTQGAIQSTQSTSTQANTQQIDIVVSTAPPNSTGDDTGSQPTTGPLSSLADNTEASGDESSDAATDDLGRSLNGHDTNVQTVALIPGVLTEVVSRQMPRGIPPADQDVSSWGNEALWRW